MELSVQREADRLLEEPRRDFAQALLDALPTAALVADGRGRIAALNLNAELFLGWNAATIQWQPIHEILDCRAQSIDDGGEDCPVAQLLSGASTEPEGRMWVRCRDGNLRPVQFHCTPFACSGGLGVLLTFQDLSRQFELERDLRRLACIAEESPIAIVELNQDANMTYANPAMVKWVERFGFTSEARPAVLPVNIHVLAGECLSNQREMAGVEVRLGETYFEWKLAPVPHAKLVRGYGIDLTSRKRAELELADAKTRAEAANRAKTEFLANTSHEIRSPIHVILGMADLLAQGSLGDEQQHYVKSIQASADRLMTLTGDILDVAALEAGSVDLENTPADFRTFIEKIIAFWRQQAKDKGLGLSLSLAEKIPARVECDYQRLAQLLEKLLSNAVKFTEEGQITVEMDLGPIVAQAASIEGSHAKGQSSQEKFYLFVAIVDSGIGISANDHEKIFDSFAQADGCVRRCYEGAGLGLALARRLVELMGGKIGVESQPNQGSKFWFVVPMRGISTSDAILS